LIKKGDVIKIAFYISETKMCSQLHIAKNSVEFS